MTTKRLPKKTKHRPDRERYVALKEYVCGKIDEMRDCKKCKLTDHQSNHLTDIEDYILQLDAEGELY
jgi:hypothetical protein